jgi:MFS family permease
VFSSPTLRPLRYRDYRVIWLGALVSNIGTWMETTALSTLIAKETKSATQVALTAMAGFLPTAFASPIGGVLADRFDRKRFLQVSLLLETLFAGLLAVLVGLGERRTLPLAALVFLASTVGAASLPNRQAVLPSLVPREDLPAAISLGSASWNGGRVFGPMLAGLVTAIGVTWAFVCNAISFLVVLLAWLTIVLPPKPDAGSGPPPSIKTMLADGFRTVKQHDRLRFAIVFIAVLAGTAGPFIGLLAIVARVQFNIGAAQFITAQGIGAVLGGLATTRFTRMFGRGRMMLGYLLALPLALVVYAYAPHRFIAIGAVLVMGGAYIGLLNGCQAILQLNSPPELRARVLAVFSVALGGPYCLALLVNGPLADAVSIRASTLFQAGATLAGVGLLALLFPGWWRESDS